MENLMRVRSICAIAAALTMGLAAVPAYADEPATEFRSAAPQTFTADDMQLYGLSEREAARAMELQAQGYQIVVLTPEEAQAYTAGITQTEWILIGIGVLIILAIA
jgi:hypothetical protein